ncbi:hypothetical protein [Hydrogeniiclostridium mannosilyticum]|uniref:Uncharacterized protein n=1 Tax=Hydrogeniiclostridium mannosilyticum TaxID=2764322 RepID=A0A328U9X2_9FIRM|nr:hypothetical protein [Hydrogeniiclostridium mannosilyticum]RAQ28122.1 hypothetical protein DPQ25_10190 [Hydrogeniiclostridium mannosilyticum]
MRRPEQPGPPSALGLMAGLPCSGKTAYARLPHAQGPGAGIALPRDVWQLALYGGFFPAAPPEERARSLSRPQRKSKKARPLF